jgi:hypothetical protein
LFIDAGRRDQTVEAAEVRNRLFNHPAAVVVAGHVALDIPGPVRRRQRRQGGLPFFPMAAADGDVPAPFQ